MCERPKSVAMSQVENGAVNGARINVTSQEATSRESMDVAAGKQQTLRQLPDAANPPRFRRIMGIRGSAPFLEL